MIRILLFLAVVAAIAAGAVWVTDTPGRVEIAWGDYVVETVPAVLAGALAVAALIGILLYWIFRFFWLGPSRIARARRLRRERLGYRALTQGLVAAAAGDPKSARRLARRSNLLLEEPPLTLLLSAQAAQLEGETATANGYFEAMLERPETEFLGLRGLLVEADKVGDNERALALAERAFRIRPETTWVLTALLELQTRAGKWAEALATVKRARRHGAIEDAAARRREAALLSARALSLSAEGAPKEGLRLAQQALGAEPGFLPAALIAVRLAKSAGRGSAAARIAAGTWPKTPHPELGALFVGLYAEATPLERMKRVEKLVNEAPNHADSHLLLARAALDAQLWGTARKHLEAAAERRPSAGVYRLLATLEEREHDDAKAAHAWLLKASEAPPDPAWLCTRCGAEARDWTIACPACAALDTLDWRQPREAPEALPDDSGTSALDAPADTAPDASADTPPATKAKA